MKMPLTYKIGKKHGTKVLKVLSIFHYYEIIIAALQEFDKCHTLLIQ